MTREIPAKSKREIKLGAMITRGGWYGNPYNRLRLYEDYFCGDQRIRIFIRYCTHGRNPITVHGFEVAFHKWLGPDNNSYWNYTRGDQCYIDFRWWWSGSEYYFSKNYQKNNIIPNIKLRESFSVKVAQILAEHEELLGGPIRFSG